MNDYNLINFSTQDYYPFGMLAAGRSWESQSEYRFGFNGQDQDDEVYGNGNSNTAKFWEYDCRLGRRWNMDPKPIVGFSSYSCFLSNPILYKDPLGDTLLIYNGHSGDLLAIIYDNMPNEIAILNNPSSTDIQFYHSFDRLEGYQKIIKNHIINNSEILHDKYSIKSLTTPTTFYVNDQITDYDYLYQVNSDLVQNTTKRVEIAEQIGILNKVIKDTEQDLITYKNQNKPFGDDPHSGPDIVAATSEEIQKIYYKLDVLRIRKADLQEQNIELQIEFIHLEERKQEILKTNGVITE